MPLFALALVRRLYLPELVRGKNANNPVRLMNAENN